MCVSFLHALPPLYRPSYCCWILCCQSPLLQPKPPSNPRCHPSWPCHGKASNLRSLLRQVYLSIVALLYVAHLGHFIIHLCTSSVCALLILVQSTYIFHLPICSNSLFFPSPLLSHPALPPISAYHLFPCPSLTHLPYFFGSVDSGLSFPLPYFTTCPSRYLYTCSTTTRVVGCWCEWQRQSEDWS